MLLPLRNQKNLFALALVVLAMACTNEAPYKETAKDEKLTPKSLVDLDRPHLYVASYGEASRTSPGSRPFWVGDEKLVKFQFTENSLQLVELEKSARFNENATNQKVVLEIPVSHIDYQCAKDQYGECTNQEEENNRLAWKFRSYFKPKITDMSVAEVSILPLELQNYFGEKCYTETSSRLLDYSFKPEAVNIKIERSFRASIECLSDDAETLSDAIFSTVYNYSIVRVDQLVSPDYEPVLYPSHDQRNMGFFNTDLVELDPDLRDVVTGHKTLLNRWNPKRGILVYHLNENFYKPENQGILTATQKGIENVNRALTEAKSGLQVVLKDGRGVDEGDIRNSFIVLVEDPLAQNVIGYGPSIANPLTGEIVSGRVVMYSGTMKKFIQRTYEEFVQKESQKKTEASLPAQLAIPEAMDPTKDVVSLVQSALKSEGELGAVAFDFSDNLNQSSRDQIIATDLRTPLDSIKDYTRQRDESTRLKDRLEAMSTHCAYPADLVNFQQSVADALKTITSGSLAPWNDLTTVQKTAIVNAVLPYVWIPTLVHEFGHNLGLRHNFAGSEDKENFYTKEELSKYGVDHDITYSSVMDYPRRSLNELPAMGKYDIAAIRYAYAREVEVKDKGFVKVSTTLKALDEQLIVEKAKRLDFRYCTDEHVAVNPGCKRFDEGSTFTEIAQNFVDSYFGDFRARHFRNGVRHFNLFGDYNATARLDYTFSTLRTMFEIYERIKTSYRLTEEQWQTHPILKDVRGASDIAAKFFIEMVKMPDTHCVLVKLEKLDQIVGVEPLARIDQSGTALSCNDSSVQNFLMQNGYVSIGEGGLSFRNRKHSSNENDRADEIDQRGIWIEKALALNYLFGRNAKSSNFDDSRKNFTHFDRYKGAVLSATMEILTDQVSAVTRFEMNNGETLNARISYAPLADQKIMEHMDPRIRKIFDLPKNDVIIDELLLRTLSREVPSVNEHENAREVMALFQVYTSVAVSGHSERDFESVNLGTRKYLALKHNVLALAVIRMIHAQRDMLELGPEKVLKILVRILEGKQLPSDANKIEKRIYKLDPGIIQAFLMGKLKPEASMIRLLELLPRGS